MAKTFLLTKSTFKLPTVNELPVVTLLATEVWVAPPATATDMYFIEAVSITALWMGSGGGNFGVLTEFIPGTNSSARSPRGHGDLTGVQSGQQVSTEGQLTGTAYDLQATNVSTIQNSRLSSSQLAAPAATNATAATMPLIANFMSISTRLRPFWQNLFFD